VSRGDLAGALLAGARLEKANLAGAEFTGANLSDAILDRANLTGAGLSDTDLSGTSLQGADLSDAALSGARLYRASLNEAVGLTQMQLEATYGDNHILLPKGLRRPDIWPVYEIEIRFPATEQERDAGTDLEH
jgi:uncharacterized protein YjbI with pentapeptide repeats